MAVQNIPRPADDRAGQTLIGAAAAMLAGRRRDIPAGFSCRSLRARDARRSRTLPAGRTRRHRRACLVVSFGAQARRGQDRLYARPTRARPWRCSKSSTTTCRSSSIRSSANSTNAAVDIRLLVHPVFTVERDEAGRLTAFKGVRKGEGRRESFIHVHVHGIEDAAQRADIVHALEEVLADVRVSVQDWRAMLARCKRGHRGPESQPAAASRRRNRRSDPVPAMDRGGQFHPARRPRLRLHRQRACARTEIRDRARTAAIARDAAVAPRQPARHRHARNPRVPAKSRSF